jgi:ATP-dependent RNA helicase SUPV3L1/SUV3
VPLDAVEAAASELATSEARPDTTEAANSVEVAAEELLIEIWRPHRQQQHRRPEARARKRPFERHDRAPAGSCAAAAPEGAAQDAPPRETVAGEPPDGTGTGEAALAQDQTGAPPKAFKGRYKDRGDRGAGEQRPRFGDHRGRRQAGGQTRAGAEEHKEGHGERFVDREKRPNERPPDPNSPFAKLLVLKARLEEKTRQEKDNQDS